MNAKLTALKAALAEVTDVELRGLVEATNDVEQIAPGLLAWLEAACDWELNRRAGIDYELQPPEAAIPPEEDEVSFGASIAIRDTFGQDLPAVRAMFDALVDLLTGSGQKH
jgi:hypothetical protein